MNLFKPKITLATHNGSFHADEVFACAILSLWAEKTDKNLKIIRTRNESQIAKADIVVDVGMRYDPEHNRVDHHQKGGAGEHENGIPYASFGLVWKHYGERVCGNAQIAKMIEEKLVVPIDARDNGIAISNPNQPIILEHITSKVIDVFNPTWQEDQNISDIQFNEALNFAKEIIKREVAVAKAEIDGAKLTREAIIQQNNPEILILENHLDWEKEVSKSKDIKLVVYQHRNGKDWCIQAGRDDLEKYDYDRASLPESWWGLREDELQSVSGIKDAIFCTNGGWFGVTRSKESAIEMAKRALRESQNAVK